MSVNVKREQKCEEEASLHRRGVLAAEAFLERREHTILATGLQEEGYPFDIVSRDENGIAFTEVIVSAGGEGFPGGDRSDAKRELLEIGSIRFMAEKPRLFADGNVDLRFDEIAMSVLSGNRAVLRHATNAFS